MMPSWLILLENISGCWTDMPSLVSARHPIFLVCSATVWLGLLLFVESKKTVCSECGYSQTGWYDRSKRRVRDLSSADTRIYLEIEIRRMGCKSCGALKRERLDFLAGNPLYTKRFAYYVGRRCCNETIKDERICTWTGTRSRSWTSNT